MLGVVSSSLVEPVKLRWMRPILSGTPPCGRNYHTASVVDNRAFIFGGYDGNKMLNDVHILELDGVELSTYVVSYNVIQTVQKMNIVKKRHDIEMRFDAICTQLQQVGLLLRLN